MAPTSGCGEECGSTAHLLSLPSFIEHTFSHLICTEFLPGPCFPHFYWWGGWEDRTCSDSCGPLPGLLLPCDATSLVCGLAFGFLPYDCNHSVRTMLCPVFFLTQHDISAFCICKQCKPVSWMAVIPSKRCTAIDFTWTPWIGNVGCFRVLLLQIMQHAACT